MLQKYLATKAVNLRKIPFLYRMRLRSSFTCFFFLSLVFGFGFGSSINAQVLDGLPPSYTAYGLRLLRSAHTTSIISPAYPGNPNSSYIPLSIQGPGIRVRRSSDDALQDIGFLPSGELDQVSLLNFIGGPNLVTFSEDLTQPSWSKVGGTISANAQFAPNGSNTADVFYETAPTNEHFTDFNYPTPTPSTAYVFSAWVKPINHINRQFVLRGVFLSGANSSFVVFDLNTGSIISNNGGLWSNVTISAAPNGFYFIRGTYNTPASIPALNDLIFRMQHFEATPQANIYAGTTSIGTAIWGVQLQPGPNALGYTPTSASPIPITPDGFIYTWYDQSGNNRHITQTNQSNQPILVNQGVTLVSSGGKPTVAFQGNGNYITSSFLTNSSASFTATNSTLNMVARWNSVMGNGNLDVPFSIGTVNDTRRGRGFYRQNNLQLGWMGNSNNVLSTTLLIDTVGNHRIYSANQNATSLTLSQNGTESLLTLPATVLTPCAGIGLGQPNNPLLAGDQFTSISISEAIAFPVSLTAAESKILNCDQSLFYSITTSLPGLGVYTTAVPDQNSCMLALEQVYWNTGTVVKATIAGNNLTKVITNAWDGGGASYNSVHDNGYLQFRAIETNRSRVIGLSNTIAGVTNTQVQFGVWLQSNGQIGIYESGTVRGNAFGTYFANDTFKVAIETGIVKYYRNGRLFYTSTVSPTLPLLAHAALFEVGASASQVFVANLNGGAFNATALNAGTGTNFQWILNGVNTGTNNPAYSSTTLANNNTVSCNLSLTGCNTGNIPSNTISIQQVVRNPSTDFYITSNPDTSGCQMAREVVKWRFTNLNNAARLNESNNSTSKTLTNGWDASSVSYNTVSAGGFMEFTVPQTNKTIAVGLSSNYTGPSFTNIDYAIYLNSSAVLQIYEAGVSRGVFGNYTASDVFRISWIYNQIRYYKNNILIYTSTLAPSGTLMVQAALNEIGAAVNNVTVSEPTTGLFTATVVNGNGTYAYEWRVNGTTVQNGPSNTYTNSGLTNGSVVTCNLVYNGCFTGPIVSNQITIQNTSLDSGLKFWITANPDPDGCYKANETVVWRHINLENTERTATSGNNITKTLITGWNAAGMSHNPVHNNGYMEFTATQTNTNRIAGLNTSYQGNNYTNVQFGVYLRSNATIEIYESGIYRGNFGNYALGDTFRIGIENNVLRYYRNGHWFFTSTIVPSAPMFATVVLNELGSTVSNVRVLNLTDGAFTANWINTGLSPNLDWHLNASPTGVNSTSYNAGPFNQGDAISCHAILTGCIPQTVVSNNITLLPPIPPPSLSYHVQVNASSTGCILAGEEVKWRIFGQDNASRLLINGNNIRKTTLAGFNAGSLALNTVVNNSWLEFIATETNTNRVAGLSNAYYGTTIGAIQYGIYLQNSGSFSVYESGANRGTFGNYLAGDTFAVALDANVIKYYKNGIMFYTSSVVPTGGLNPAVVLNEINATITDAVVWKRTNGSYTAITSNAGPTSSFQWMLNGVNTGTTASTYTNNTTTLSDTITCILRPTNCQTSQIVSNRIRFKQLTPNKSLAFYIEGVHNQSACTIAQEEVVWKFTRFADEIRTQRNGNSITKLLSTGWDQGAASYNTVKNGGYLEFRAVETNTARMCGLSAVYGVSGYTSIQFAFYLQANGSVGIYESGANRGAFGTYVNGDVFRISAESGTVKYFKNGVLLYTSTLTPNMPLMAHAALNNIGSTISNARIFNYNAGTFQAIALQATTNPLYIWKLNGVTVQSGLSDVYTNNNLNNGDTITCDLNLNGCLSAFTYQSNKIGINIVPQQPIDFCILGVPSSLNCKMAVEQVKWKMSDLTLNMSIINNSSLVKTAGNGFWNGGAASWNTVENNGYFEFKATETNKLRAAGLSTTNPNATQGTIQFAFLLQADGTFGIIESGTSRGNFGPYSANDLFTIKVTGNVVKYYRNNNLIYISTLLPVLPMLADVSINETGGTITDAVISNPNNGTFISNLIGAGTYQWLVNGSIVQTSASHTYTNTNLNNNDTVRCILTTNFAGCQPQIVQSNYVQNVFVLPNGSEFHIQPVTASGTCLKSIEQVKWRSSTVTNSSMNITGFNNLIKMQNGGSWNAGAASLNQVHNNGYFEFTAVEANKARSAGLSVSNSSGNFSSIQFNIYLMNNGTFRIYESGVDRGQFGTYLNGDVFRIAVENNLVRYYKNGYAVYTSQITPNLPLIADASFLDIGATLKNPNVSNYHGGTIQAYPINAGSNPTYEWKRNGTTVQTGASNTYTNSLLAVGDTIVCLMTTSNTGCMPFTVGTDTILIQNQAPALFDFAIVSETDTATCTRVTEPVRWRVADLSRDMVVTGPGGLRKIQGALWDGGAFSWNRVFRNGYFEFTALETNKARMIGLSSTNPNNGFSNIQYAIYLKTNSTYEIRQSGATINVTSPNFSAGDVFRIFWDNNEIKYYKNGLLVYTSMIPPSATLYVDVCINDGGGTVHNAYVNNLGNGSFTAQAVNAGSNPTYNWKVNGSIVLSSTASTYTNLTLNTGDQVTCELGSPLTGCTNTILPSNTISIEANTQPGTDFAITATATPFACARSSEEVRWKKTDLTLNMAITGVNDLEKTSDNTQWNGGAASWNKVANNGQLEFVSNETNKMRMIGLSTSSIGPDQASIRYAILLENTGTFKIYETGIYRNVTGAYNSGDIFRIAVEANVIRYYRNGQWLYTSALAPTLPLVADVSIFEIGGTVKEARITNFHNGLFTASAVNAGANPNYTWILNGTVVQSGNSSTYTNTTLVSGDSLYCNILANLAGCGNLQPLQSNRIRIETSDPAQSDFHIKGVVNPTSCSVLIEDVKWKKSDLVNCIANTNNLTKTISDGIWDGGSASWNTVALNGYFQFTTSENNKGKAAGLSVTNTNALNTSILYAFLLTANGELRITESGTDRGINNTYVAGDILRISIETVAGVNRARYYKNGVLIYTSTLTASTLPMLVDVSLYNIGSTISQATVGNLNSGGFTASTLNMGTPTYRWYLNGVLVQNGISNTYTNASITHLDQVYCIATPGLNGCSNTSINSNSTAFNGSFITVTNPPAVCEPNTVDLTAPGITAGTGPDMVLTYWLDAAATIPMPAPTLATGGTYYIKGVRRGACTDIKPVTVTVNPSPTASILSASGNQITCATTSINLTIQGTGSYLWDNGLTTATRVVTNPGTYVASVTSASGCARTTTFTVFQNTVPPVMYINGNTSPICQGATVNLQAVPSIFNNAMRLDGVAQYAAPGDWFNYQNFTIEMWLRAGSSQTPSATILDNNHLPGVRSWVVQQNAGNANQYQFTCYNTQGASATATFTLTANTWQHVTLVKSPNALTVYINGAQTTTIPWTLGAIKYDNSQLLRIGKWGGGTRFWNGQIDELRIFAKDISATRINSDMNSWFPSITDDLIAVYKFDEPDNSLFISNATNFVAGNAPVYGGANFITSGIPLSSTYTYAWVPGGSTNNSISFIPTGTQIYNAIVTGVNGCSTNDTTEISVSLNGVATVTGSTPGCQNTTPGTITITGSGAIAPYTFYYTVNGVPTSSTTAPNSSSVTIQAPNTASGTFLYDINNLTYANASFCLQAQTAQASITVNPEPLINSVTDGFRCDSGVVNLGATSAASINWFTTPTGGNPIFTGTNYTTPTLTATTIYYVSALSSQGCSSSVRTPVDAVVEYPGMWMGYTSDWDTPFNWGCSILPTSTTNVTIPTTPIGNFFPVVNSSGISVCANITIQPSASVTINNGRNLSVFGNILNNGAANWGAGEIRLAGSSQQQISASATQVMGRLQVNNTTAYNAIKLSTDLSIDQQINFIDGVIDLNGRTLNLGTATANGTIIGQSAASYVHSNNGFLRIRTNTNTTYSFPVGDSLYYTPYVLQLNSGAVAGSDIRVKVVNASHPNLSAGIDRILRFWSVEPTGLAANKNYNATYVYAGAFEVLGPGTLYPVKYSLSSAVPGWNGCPGSVVWAVTGSSGSHNPATFTLQWNGLTDFSDFTAAGNNVPLPVELLTLEAIQQGDNVLVSWITASELNNDRFEVERSNDGVQFNRIGTRAGQGTTSLMHQYSFTDEGPEVGINYYRLRQIDLDGTENLTDPVAVVFRKEQSPISIFHDAAQGSMVIQATNEAGSARVALFDASGKAAFNYETTVSENWNTVIKLPDLSKGVYFIRCELNGFSSNLKITLP